VNQALLNVDRVALWAVWIGLAVAAAIAVAVIVERLGQIAHERLVRRLRRRYGPAIERALHGDAEAFDTLVRSPSRYRLELARLLIFPLVNDRNPERIALAREPIDVRRFRIRRAVTPDVAVPQVVHDDHDDVRARRRLRVRRGEGERHEREAGAERPQLILLCGSLPTS
jgi:hypothetical protein